MLTQNCDSDLAYCFWSELLGLREGFFQGQAGGEAVRATARQPPHHRLQPGNLLLRQTDRRKGTLSGRTIHKRLQRTGNNTLWCRKKGMICEKTEMAAQVYTVEPSPESTFSRRIFFSKILRAFSLILKNVLTWALIWWPFCFLPGWPDAFTRGWAWFRHGVHPRRRIQRRHPRVRGPKVRLPQIHPFKTVRRIRRHVQPFRHRGVENKQGLIFQDECTIVTFLVTQIFITIYA